MHWTSLTFYNFNQKSLKYKIESKCYKSIVILVRSILIQHKQMNQYLVKLFLLMHRTLLSALNIKNQAIFITGQVRVGKSTSFNWIQNHQTLIGGGNPINPVFNISQKKSRWSKVAQIKDCYQSVTLIPNIKLIENDTISLIDLPGNKDRRTQVDVMMVSFILNACFKASKKAKFIIVISNDGFMSTDGKKFTDTLRFFVSLFSNLTEEQFNLVVDSVSMLVTAVPIPSGQETKMKKNYLELLLKNLQKLQHLVPFDINLKQIYDKISKIVANILINQRLELFPRAKLNQSPQRCNLLQRFKKQGWKFNDLSTNYDKIKFPYAEQFKELQENQKLSLNSAIQAKIHQFEQLELILADFVTLFLKSPLSIDKESFTSIFQRLEQLLEDTSYCDLVPFDSNKYQDNESDHFSSIKIIKDLLILHSFTFEIAFDNDRSEESKAKESYFGYLKGYFIRTIQIFKNCFARKGKENYVMDNILTVFSQGFDFLTYICSIEPLIKSTAHHRLKQAISVMNIPNYSSLQIKFKYFQKLGKENITQKFFRSENQIIQVLELLEAEKPEQYDMIIFACLEKFYKIYGQKLYDRNNFLKSLKCYLKALANSVKKMLCLEYQQKIQMKEEKQLFRQIVNLKEEQKKVVKIIKEIMKEIMDKKSENLFMKEKIRVFINSHKEFQEGKIQESIQSQKWQEKCVTLVAEIMQTIIKEDFSISIDSIQQQIANYYKTKEEKIMTGNEFQIELPQKMTNYEVIAYSKFLISKVNKRKIVLLLGKKAGKSTVSYWLRGKELAKIEGKNYQYFYDIPSNSKQKRRINRSQTVHTQVPNIFRLDQTQFLVDCPHIYNNCFEKQINAGFVTKSLIQGSSECKFILVIKEEDILSNNSAGFIEQLYSYVKMFKDIRKNPTLFKGLMIIITFGTHSNKNKIDQSVKLLLEQFQSQGNLEIFKQKYKISCKESQRIIMYKLINQIFQKNLFSYFDVEDEYYKQKGSMIEKLSNHWTFTTVGQSSLLSKQYFSPLSFMSNQQQLNLQQKILKNNELILTIGKIINQIVDKFIQALETDKKADVFSLEQSLKQTLGKQWDQNKLQDPQSKLLKSILYPNLKQIKKYEGKVINILSITHSLLKLHQITKNWIITFQKSIDWIGDEINQVMTHAVQLLALDSQKLALYEACRLKLYHTFTELSVISQQIYLPEQITKTNDQNFHRTLQSDYTRFKDQLSLANKIKISQIILFFQKKFNLKQFEEVAKTDPTAMDLLYRFLMLFQNHYKQDNQNFLNDIFDLFVGKETDSRKCLQVLCCQAFFNISNKQSQQFSSQQLKYRLKAILCQMSIKMASIDINFAFQICDWHNNVQTICQVFVKKIQNAQEKKPIVEELLSFLIRKTEKEDKFYEALNKYHLLLKKQEREEWEKAFKTRPQINNNSRQIDNLSEKIQEYIARVKTKI